MLGDGCDTRSAAGGVVLMGHGSGGRLSRELVEGLIVPALGKAAPSELDDGAAFSPPPGELVFTTDAHVVSPLEFPGGDLGTLCVSGTVNDLAVMGARPIALSLALVLEEGFPLGTLRRLLESAGRTAARAGVRVVCGDTKVVERGKGDGVYAVTSGIGVRYHATSADDIRPGDAILVNGTVGDHGFTLLTHRRGFPLRSPLESDAAPLNGLVEALCARVPVRWMRDPTRGGVATALCELCEGRGWSVILEEADVPLHPAVRGVSEILGLDPLYSANEGKFLAVVPSDAVDEALAVLRADPLGANAARIGYVAQGQEGRLLVRSPLGGLRTMGMLASDPLPRIC